MTESASARVSRALMNAGVPKEEITGLLQEYLEEQGAPIAYFRNDMLKWTGRIAGAVTIDIIKGNKDNVEITEADYRALEELGLL